MKCVGLLLSALLLASSPGDARAAQAGITSPARPAAEAGRPLFELLGLMGEYIVRQNGNEEGFYANERAIADRFEAVLAEFAAMQRVDPGVVRTNLADGNTRIQSLLVGAIDLKYYKGQGTLSRSTFADATEADLLRYLKGAYLRFGLPGSAGFLSANSGGKFSTIGLVLSRLGCRDVRVFQTNGNWFPSSVCLLFEPSERVARAIGPIQRLTIEQHAERGRIPIGDWRVGREIVWSEAAWIDRAPPGAVRISRPEGVQSHVTIPAAMEVSIEPDLLAIRALVTKEGSAAAQYRVDWLAFESPVRAVGQAVFGDGNVLLNPRGPAEFVVVKDGGAWRLEKFSPGS